MKLRVAAVAATAILAIGGAGCSKSNDKTYDISPIFPLSQDKCATYNGKQSGEGFGATCMVSKADCERAVSDWREAMRSSGVQGAVEFSCK